jgi:DNA (cytosine-5)-methyltransferase 1
LKKPIKIVELFSGIGSQARAFKKIGADFCTVGTCEWDIRAMVAYDLIHNGDELHKDVKFLSKKELLEKLSKLKLSADFKNPLSFSSLKSFNENILKRIYSAILKTKNFVNINELDGSKLEEKIDVMTYSFPCQDLSNVGNFHGYNKGIDRDANNRSGLLWQVERILNDRHEKSLDMPKVLILENVTTLLATRHNTNFEDWKTQLANLGYYNKVYSLNAKYFGSAQNRQRLIMISIKTDNKKEIHEWFDEYFDKHNLENVDYRKKLKIKQELAKKHLKLDMSNLKYFEEAKLSQPNKTPSRLTIWNNNLKIVDEQGLIKDNIATITTKQDRHPNSGNIYFDYDGNIKSKYRFLTPRECFCFMGFTEKDYEKIIKNNIISRGKSMFFSRDKLLHLAGNSISIQVLEQVFKQVVDILEYLENK